MRLAIGRGLPNGHLCHAISRFACNNWPLSVAGYYVLNNCVTLISSS